MLVVPPSFTAEQVKASGAQAVFLSNGPGDPAEPVEVIENLKQIFALNIPTFGICLGHQLSALAAGAKTMKLKYGHRGANQPVTDFESGPPSSPARTTAMRWWARSCPPRWARWHR